MKDLLRKLEIEDLEDLAYFEAFCSLMEHEEQIDEEKFYDLLTGLEFETLCELMDAYLEEIMEKIKGNKTEETEEQKMK